MHEDTTTETELALERRLQREAATNRLAILIHPELHARLDDPNAQSVRVEVTYQLAGERERCGYLAVYVPSHELPEDEYEALALHPCTLAEELAAGWLEALDAEYTSVDDASSF